LAIAKRAVFFRRFSKTNGALHFGHGSDDGFVPVNRVAFRVIRAAVKRFAAFGFFDGDFAVLHFGQEFQAFRV
jgi:hypothetical protein